ncbi:hypothetical protein Pcinc_043763, partial [Petrolisthes cinctipes]
AEVEVLGSPLGLMIRGGSEYGLGIYITGVDKNSAAQKAGLQIGDQILEANNESFLTITHDTAVNIMKYSRKLKLALRRVGKIPYSYHDETTRSAWPTNGDATLTMIDVKSQRVLSPAQHMELKSVIEDYAAGRRPIEDLLFTAKEILISPDKLGLLTEVREVVRLEDQAKFDQAVFPSTSTTTNLHHHHQQFPSTSSFDLDQDKVRRRT